jgi:ribosome-associated translation inhibitor RaiA
MQCDVIGNRMPYSKALWEHADLRVRIAVSRFVDRIERITVRLKDTNGHRGGVDKCCSIEVLQARGEPVVVEATDADAYVAIDLATTKLKRAITKASRLRWERPRRSGDLALGM